MRTIVDWFAFRAKGDGLEHVMQAVRDLFRFQGYGLAQFSNRGKGWQGYTDSADIRLEDLHVGRIAWGGSIMRGWIYVGITGTGCALVKDWDRAQDVCRKLTNYQMRRVDLALDVVDGSLTYERALAAHEAGEFKGRGRPPEAEQYLGVHSRTLYVGSRDGDRYARIYEKGLQLAGASGITHINGVRVQDWVRAEVEFKPESGPLAPDLIDRRDDYFAGAYPFLASLLESATPLRWKFTPREAAQVGLDVSLRNVRRQFGDTLFTALMAYEGDAHKLLAAICSGKHSAKLVKAGVLMVEHQ